MKRALLIGIAAIAAFLAFNHGAFATGPILVVDDVSYEATHIAGSTYHWETPGSTPTSASFAERGQTWVTGDNGTEHLPCEFGVHWISNENTLNVSHCLEGSTPSTTGPTTTSTTTTISTTLSPTTTSSLPAATTTAPETTSSTSSPNNSSSTSSLPTSTLSPTATTAQNPNQQLPKTGSGNWMAVAIGSACLALGALMVHWRRRYG